MEVIVERIGGRLEAAVTVILSERRSSNHKIDCCTQKVSKSPILGRCMIALPGAEYPEAEE